VILTDREIQIAIERKLIVSDPEPPDTSYSSTSVDVTLAAGLTVFTKPRTNNELIVDPNQHGFNPETSLGGLTEEISIGEKGFALAPRVLCLGWTVEYINLKIESRLAARIEGKSSLARIGLGVHVTAPTIHSGFNGRIRLEIVNHGNVPIRLRTAMKIAQLIFEQTLGTPNKGYQGRFAGQGTKT
jgi:dCTP deaminase